MDGVFHHLIHEIILIGIAKLDTAEAVDDGNNKILEHLVIEILADKKSGVLIAREKGLFRFLGQDHGEGEAEDGEHNETGPGKKFDQPELLAILRFFLKTRFHEMSALQKGGPPRQDHNPYTPKRVSG
jgi:hypothetical protein